LQGKLSPRILGIVIKFEDNKEGVIDISKIIEFTGIFTPLKELDYFQTVKLNPEWGTIYWDNGADLVRSRCALFRYYKTTITSIVYLCLSVILLGAIAQRVVGIIFFVVECDRRYSNMSACFSILNATLPFVLLAYPRKKANLVIY
jgi:hypothetical protein